MALTDEEVRGLRTKARELRCLMIDVTTWAGGAHIGGALSCADILTALYYKYLNVRPQEPDWPERDRFVLSKGHAGVGLASVLADRGYFPEDLLHEFNHFKSPFGMHLDGGKVPGVDASTGSLGHGLSQAAGMAWGARYLGESWLTYCLLGDGECNEGSVWEAAMAASHFRLTNLITFVDRNRLMIDGSTEDVMSLEPLADKWRAFGFQVVEIDGHDFGQIAAAIEGARARARRPVPETPGAGRPAPGAGVAAATPSSAAAGARPTVIIADTVKGKGVDFMENNVKWHYGSLDSELAGKAKASVRGVAR